VLFLALTGGVAALNFNRVFGDPQHVKTVVAQSGVYRQLPAAILKQSQSDEQKNGASGTVSFQDQGVQQAEQNTLTPAFIQKSFETFIDANYSWLEGKSSTPVFNIDLTGTKSSFADQVGAAVTQHLKSLPTCTPAQLAQIQLPVNPLTVSCRPDSLNPAAEGQRVAQELKDNQDFLKQSSITPTTLNPQQTQQKPYYRSISAAPHLFRLGKALAYLLWLLAALAAVGIVFIAVTRRRGWRRVGVVTAFSGLVLIVTKFVADSLTHLATDHLQGVGSELKAPLTNLIKVFESETFGSNLWCGVVFLVMGVGILVWLWRTRGRQPAARKSEAPAAPTDPVVDALSVDADTPEQPTPKADIPAPAKPSADREVKTAPLLKDAGSVPKMKSDDKPKGPPLIQG